jgi:hypothetical protein
MVWVQCMELADHVLRMREVLCQQPIALFRRASFVLHTVAQRTVPVLTLEDLLKLVLLLTVYFDRQRRFGRCTPVGYVRL